jgi:hypothetical protein
MRGGIVSDASTAVTTIIDVEVVTTATMLLQ